jgi:hypothetical protein
MDLVSERGATLRQPSVKARAFVNDEPFKTV